VACGQLTIDNARDTQRNFLSVRHPDELNIDQLTFRNSLH